MKPLTRPRHNHILNPYEGMGDFGMSERNHHRPQTGERDKQITIPVPLQSRAELGSSADTSRSQVRTLYIADVEFPYNIGMPEEEGMGE